MAQYLPVLLVSVSAVAPDDSNLDTQATGQVDYLSHEWQEEDVAKSWRNMTRRKDSIQNGVRLENASWRTWWKQRNNLPTVSPETLNWLKDSDVTWLYGPLHTAVDDWAPPRAHQSSCHSPSPSPDLEHQPSGREWAVKSILKHRTISELLSLSIPPSPGSDGLSLEDEADPLATTGAKFARPVRGAENKLAPVTKEEPARPYRLKYTKSDTNIMPTNLFRRPSPPIPLDKKGARPRAERSRDSSNSDTHQKRHITFNTFVEQCIALEKPEKHSENGYSDGDEEGAEDDDDGDTTEESEDEMLHMRTTRSRSGSASTLTLSQSSFSEHEKARLTIAPIAPTMLKTTSAPSSPDRELYAWHAERQQRHQYKRDEADLLYVPPEGSPYTQGIYPEVAKPENEGAKKTKSGGFFNDAELIAAEAEALREARRQEQGDVEKDDDDDVDVDEGAEDYVMRSSRRRSRGSSTSTDETIEPPTPTYPIPIPPSSAAIPVPSHSTSRGRRNLNASLSPTPSSSTLSSSSASSRGRSPTHATEERGRSRSRSRSRSLGASPLEGSVSPRSGSHTRHSTGSRRYAHSVELIEEGNENEVGSQRGGSEDGMVNRVRGYLGSMVWGGGGSAEGLMSSTTR